MRRLIRVLLLNMAEHLRSPKDQDQDRRGSEHTNNQIAELLLEILHVAKKIMIAQSSLDASLAGLTAAVSAAAAALAAGDSTTSTPDAAVAAYQAGVDAQTVALAAATPTVAAAAKSAAK